MSRTKQELPMDRPMSDAEWDQYLTELTMMEMLQEDEDGDE